MKLDNQYLIIAVVIIFISIVTYYMIDREELSQEPIIEIGQEQDLVKNRLTHDEIQSIDDDIKESAARPFTGRG